MNYNVFNDTDTVCITTDLDWASDIAIEEMLNFFKGYSIRPTVFVTHKSDVIDRRRNDIDLGIHPNFVQPSSQGNDITSIIDYCMKLVPDSRCFRCHRWYSSNDIYDEFVKRGLVYESNICTDMDVTRPFLHRSGMVSFPVFFEDGAFVWHERDFNYNLWIDSFRKNGLKILNIHPMHFALNTPYFKYTRNIKDTLSREEWNNMDMHLLKRLSYQGRGIRNMIEDIINDIIKRQAGVISLHEAYVRVKGS